MCGAADGSIPTSTKGGAVKNAECRTIRGQEVWIVDEEEVWRVWCADCGIRLGTVNAGNEDGAARFTYDHRRGFLL